MICAPERVKTIVGHPVIDVCNKYGYVTSVDACSHCYHYGFVVTFMNVLQLWLCYHYGCVTITVTSRKSEGSGWEFVR